MTEISLIVTLNNQFNSTQLKVLQTKIDNIFIGKRNADYVEQSVPIHI